MSMPDVDEGIESFKKRMETELEFCKELFEDATIKVMAAKYAYYIESNPYKDDYSYDVLEKQWYIMGRALGLLTEEDTSPCIDFDEKHPMAKKGIALAKRLMRK